MFYLFRLGIECLPFLTIHLPYGTHHILNSHVFIYCLPPMERSLKTEPYLFIFTICSAFHLDLQYILISYYLYQRNRAFL